MAVCFHQVAAADFSESFSKENPGHDAKICAKTRK